MSENDDDLLARGLRCMHARLWDRERVINRDAPPTLGRALDELYRELGRVERERSLEHDENRRVIEQIRNMVIARTSDMNVFVLGTVPALRLLIEGLEAALVRARAERDAARKEAGRG